MMTLRPLNTRILLRPIKAPAKIGSIIIPETARDKQQEQGRQGVVVSMGPGMLMKTGARWPMPECKPGDTVIFGKHAGQDIRLADENGEMVDHIVVRDDDLLAVVEKEGANA